MLPFYNLLILIMQTSIRIAGLSGNTKAKAFIKGRKNILKQISAKATNVTKPLAWIHCASLGEFEQARPVIEAIRAEFPGYRIALTFFSPSGYEVRKDYPLADLVTYLPIDTKKNAERFIDILKPTIAFFVKYEFWYHYAATLRAKKIPLISVSSIFREDQFFFSGLGGFYRKILKQFDHFFVQNHNSVTLLRSIGIKNVTLAGDTRFDRVAKAIEKAEPIKVAERFKADQQVFVVGSSWPEDIDVLMPMINENRLKFIIAPHEIDESSLSALERSLQVKFIRFSQASEKNLEDYTVLIIDNIGMLSRLYQYGEFAFVGGAYGKGLHNILEAACYGIPIFFGNRSYQKFQEAVDLINRGGAFVVRDYPDLKTKYELLTDPSTFLLACEVTRQYVEENLGATEKIMSFCRPLLQTKQ